MRKLISVILLLTSNVNVLCRILPAEDNVVINAELEFFNPYPIRPRAVPQHGWGSDDNDSAERFEDPDRLIFPGSDWGVSSTSKTSPQNSRQCITTCQPGSRRQPVCGTDNVTYFNIEQLQCFQKCGIDVDIRYFSACQVETSSDLEPTPTDDLESCMDACPTTPEYNPVCGTDNKTYKNNGKLTCAQFCGKDVQLSRRAPCPKIAPSTEDPFITTTATPRSTTLSSAVRSCIWSCPSTAEYSPVCGTNRQTYPNQSKLQCASYCGVDVSLLKSVPCNKLSDLDSSIEVTTKVTTTPRSISNHTIPQDILDSIFNKKKDDDNYDIDFRYPSD